MSNALAGESSPYLRQHADNPVDWLPWSDAALERARAENKPILLSIGYSACHWCHVMAHESFEDKDTAAIMNANFINIKVDREERPDLDRIYQTAHQLLAQRPGGWPLTMFLAPADQLPFFGGTYFPREPKYGMISFRELLERIAGVYRDEPDKIRQQGEAVRQALIQIELAENQNRQAADVAALEIFDRQMLSAYDREHGGFGQAPKFPQPAILRQALRRAWAKTGGDPVYRAIDHTLERIAAGGIQDHVGGGFFRYSVDAEWMIPHFEKMLYDNGQLLQVFAEAYALAGRPAYRDAVDGIVAWLEAEMRAPSGAWYAALDADSEGEEGKFYLWEPDEVREIVGDDAWPALAWRFGLDRPANFEGRWHLHGYRDAEATAGRFALDADAYTAQHVEACTKLLAARARRVRPGLDDKILTSWNALAARGLAAAARVFARADYHALARRCVDALRAECWLDDRLLALARSSGKRLPAYLDDYALLLAAVLDCLQFEWDGDLLEFAVTLAARLLDDFEDKTNGGFYFTAIDHEKLIQRPKSWQDEAMPSGNAIAALALHRLGLLLGEQRYCDSAERALQSVADNLNQVPFHAAGFNALLDEANSPPLQLIVRGNTGALVAWRAEILPRLAPAQSAYLIPADAKGLPPALADKTGADLPAAWPCEGFACRAPIQDLDAVLAEIRNPPSDVQ